MCIETLKRFIETDTKRVSFTILCQFQFHTFLYNTVARMLITKIQNHHRLTLAHHLVIRIINKHVCDNLWVADIHHYTSLWIYLEQHAGRDQITRVTRATIAEVVGDGHATGSMGLEA